MKSKIKPTRARLKMEEIIEIESRYRHAYPYEDIKKLTKHIRLVEHLLSTAQKIDCPQCLMITEVTKGRR